MIQSPPMADKPPMPSELQDLPCPNCGAIRTVENYQFTSTVPDLRRYRASLYCPNCKASSNVDLNLPAQRIE